MIEYLIFDEEESCLKAIQEVKEIYQKILLDFPIKFKNIKTNEMKYIFVVMEDYAEYVKPYTALNHTSIPEELVPIES